MEYKRNRFYSALELIEFMNTNKIRKRNIVSILFNSNGGYYVIIYRG